MTARTEQFSLRLLSLFPLCPHTVRSCLSLVASLVEAVAVAVTESRLSLSLIFATFSVVQLVVPLKGETLSFLVLYLFKCGQRTLFSFTRICQLVTESGDSEKVTSVMQTFTL